MKKSEGNEPGRLCERQSVVEATDLEKELSKRGSQGRSDRLVDIRKAKESWFEEETRLGPPGEAKPKTSSRFAFASSP